jgi:nitrate reductase / nitrite oxidoreductase, beta subunit
MRVMAQLGMVMNLDKCLGCHTCSITCKQAWTNRPGMEYTWYNNVETKPGLGYPRTYEDQDRWRGGWKRTRRGLVELRAGGRLWKLLRIFANPDLPQLSDYYEPWTYDYQNLINSPAQAHLPVARPKSLVTGDPMQIRWSANWDDDLGGAPEYASNDPVLRPIAERVKLDYEQVFMFYLPRICEHCLNPSCVASCPAGAIYKRTEDGIVLVDQDDCRGWRFCVSGCPYKKVYFNHRTGKSEKCLLCYPRMEAGEPTICSETCVGRMRYLGVWLYDADRVLEAAAADDANLVEAHRSILLDPHDPAILAAAHNDGIADDWLDAAARSPIYALSNQYRVALPLHPEYRTVPMVWYVPPLSPVVNAVMASGGDANDPRTMFGAIDAFRIPIEYLAGLLAAGEVGPVTEVLKTMVAMRAHMRRVNLGQPADAEIAASAGSTPQDLEDLYRLLAIAKYEERYVIPIAHAEGGRTYLRTATEPGFDYPESPIRTEGPAR